MTFVSQLGQDSEEEDDDEDAAECLLKPRVQRLTCEATTSEPQRTRQAEVRRANDHPHQDPLPSSPPPGLDRLVGSWSGEVREL